MTQTPLERLDDAIHEFMRETGGEDKVLTGWVLGYSTSRVEPSDTDLPLITGACYALGPQTSTTNAAGITRFLDVVLERATWGVLEEE